jgi:hypothetical protein
MHTRAQLSPVRTNSCRGNIHDLTVRLLVTGLPPVALVVETYPKGPIILFFPRTLILEPAAF